MPGRFDDLIPDGASSSSAESHGSHFADLIPDESSTHAFGDEPKRGLAKDIPLQAVGGLRDAVDSMIRLLERSSLVYGRQARRIELPEVPAPESTAGGFTRGLAQFATGFVPGMQGSKILGIGSGAQRLFRSLGGSQKLAKVAGLFASTEAAAQFADQVAFDPRGQRLSNLVEDIPELANPVTAYLAADPEDGEAEARFKVALEGAGIGAIIPAVVAGAKGLRSALKGAPGRSGKAEPAGKALAEETGTQGRFDDLISRRNEGRPGKPTGTPDALMRADDARPELFIEAPLGRKAGNIRLDKLETTDDVSRAITATADEFGGQIDEARRGRISEAQTQHLADELGMTPDHLMQRRQGQAFNAEEALAARQILVTSGEDLAAKARSAIGGTDTEVLAFRRALERHAGIQAQVAGMTAEAGRALRQFRMVAGADSERAIKETLDRFGGRDNVEEIARQISKIDTPGGRARFIHSVTRAKASDKLLEAWINALLSGPQTHAVNALSNTLVAAWTLPEHLLAAGIGAARRGNDRVRFGEVTARAFGAVQGVRDGLKAAAKTFLTEEPSDLLSKIETSRYNAIPSFTFNKGQRKKRLAGIPVPLSGQIELGGKQVRIPGRALAASDEFFKAIGYRMELNARALRDGLSKGLKGKELTEHVESIVRNPPEDLSLAAIDAARYQTFTKPLGLLGKSVQSIAASHPAFRLVMPFIRTPANIAKFAIERSPFALMMREVRDNLRVGGATRDIQLARMTMGTGIGAVVAQLAAEGKITGGGPTDRTSRAALRMTGWQQYSFKLGDEYVSFSRLEPLGMIFGIAADFAEITGELEQAEADDVAGRIVGSITQNLTSKTFLRGLSEAIQALDDPDRYGARWIQSFAGTLIPTGVAQVARTEDPVLRDTQTILDRLKSRLPGYSESLPARRNLWGEPIVLGGGVGPDLISPIYSSFDRHDKTSEEFARLNVRSGLPQRQISSKDLSPEQYWRYVEIAGQAAKLVLDRLVADPGYAELPDDARRELFERTIRSTRGAARKQMLRELAASDTRPAAQREPQLSQGDIESPLPNSMILEGKRILESALSEGA